MPVVLSLGLLLAPILSQSELLVEHLGNFDTRRIPEASGVAASRRYPGIFWVHNDSGNPSSIFAIRKDGSIVREFPVALANVDWEDIAADDQGHLYLGDIGNNGGLLALRAIYRLDEPDPAGPAREPLRPTGSWFYALPREGASTPRGCSWTPGHTPRLSSPSGSTAATPSSSAFRSSHRRRC